MMNNNDLKIQEEIKNKLGNKLIENINNDNSKVLLYTHYDLDGIGNVVLLSLLETELTYKIFPNNANKCVEDMEYWNVYTDIVFTDLSVSEEVANKIDEFKRKNPDINIILLDHHESAEYLNKYEWAYEKSQDLDNKILSSGTLLLFLYLNVFNKDKIVKEFADRVAIYDTYYFNHKNYNSDDNYYDYPVCEAKNLNILFKYYYKKDFIDTIVDCIIESTAFKYNSLFSINNNNNKMIIDVINNLLNKECYTALFKGKIYITDTERKIFFFYDTGTNKSDIAEYIYSELDYIDIVCIADPNKHTISLRTDRDNINLVTEYAIPNNGGGHQKACGFKIPDDESFDANNIMSKLSNKIISIKTTKDFE